MIPGLEQISALSLARDIERTLGAGAAAQGAAGPPAPGGAGDPTGTAGTISAQSGFADAMRDVAGRMAGDLRTAEAMSLAGIRGEVDTRTVVDAVMTAEQSLQTAIAIRDKIVTAYLEISRMAI